MNTEQKLTQYIKEKYNPIALVLHGSRANGNYREHSDWDFLMFTYKDIEHPIREIVFDSNIELKQIILPIAEDKFLGFFFRSENVKILYDPELMAEKFLKLNDVKVQKGNIFTDEERKSRYCFLKSALDGIIDYADSPLNIFDKKADFYTRVINAWFRFVKKEFEPSYYIAFPRMNKEAPELQFLIEKFVYENDAQKLFVIGNDILNILFPDVE